MASSSSHVSNITSVGKQNPDYSYERAMKVCECGLPAPRWTSWTNINPGMRFWRCPLSGSYGNPEERDRYRAWGDEEQGCGYFEWQDFYIRGRARDVINGLKERERNLKRENQRLPRQLENLWRNSNDMSEINSVAGSISNVSVAAVDRGVVGESGSLGSQKMKFAVVVVVGFIAGLLLK